MRFFLRIVLNLFLISSLFFSPLSLTYSFENKDLSTINIGTYSFEKVFTYTILKNNIEITGDNNSLYIDIQGFKNLITPGQPTLLYKNIEMEIKEPVSVIIEDTCWEELKYNNHEILFSDFKFSPLLKTTSSDIEISTSLPGTPIDYRLIGNSECSFLSLSFYPLQFRNGKLHYLKKISFSFQKNSNTKIQTKNDHTTKGIIISPDEWAEEAEILKSQHYESGCESEIHFLSEFQNISSTIDSRCIGSTCGLESVSFKHWGKLEAWDFELAKKIQSFLIDATKDTSYDFITILGDGSIIPPSFYAYENRDDMYNFVVPTDFFYMSPNGGGNNLIIEMSLGRIPARDVKELNEYLEKLSCWKISEKKDWFSNVSLIGGDLFHGNYAGELACQSLVNKNYFDNMKVKTCYASDGKCNEVETKKVFEDGNQGFVNLAAHGSGSEVRIEPGFLNAADLYQMDKSSNQPILFSYSCMNGAFDTRISGASFETDTAFHYPTSFGEAMIFSPSGSIAYVGGSRMNFAGFSIIYDSEGLAIYSNPMQMDAMCNNFFESYSSSNYLGDMCSSALFKYCRNYWSHDSSLFSFSRFTLLGDPVLLLPHNQPDLNKDELEVSFTTPIVKNTRMDYQSLPFLPIDSTVIVKTNGCSKIIVCNYDNPGEIIQTVDQLEDDSIFAFNDLPSTRICFKFLDRFSREQRYVFNGARAHDLEIQHNFSVIKEIYPNEVVPYRFEIKNCGLENESSLKIEITLVDEEEVVHFSKTIKVEEIYQEETNHYFTKIHMPDLEGAFTLINSVSVLNANNLDYTVFDTYKTPLNCSKEKLYRVGLPCNNYYLSKLESSINPQDMNNFFINDNVRLEVCLFPIDELQNYSFSSLILFDSYWVPWKNNSSIFTDLFEIFSSFCNSGGIILGCSPPHFSNNRKNQRALSEFFGIKTNNKFSMTNYSRFSRPIYISESANPDFCDSFYFIQSRANWEPFPDCSWEDISLTETCNLIGTSYDKRVCLLQNKETRYFLSCTFLSSDINCIEDQTFLLFKDILVSKSNCVVPFSTIFNY